MNKRTFSVGAGLALVLLGLASPAWGASPKDECRVERPQPEVPGSGTTDTAPDETADSTLSDRLATCGSVLDPPPIGDADIVEPTPPIIDDMNIHPEAPPARP